MKAAKRRRSRRAKGGDRRRARRQGRPGAHVVETRNCLYEPRDHQLELHRVLKRFGVLVAHRRFGKTVFAIGHLVRKAGKCGLEAGRFAYIAPFYRQAKAVAWDYLKRYTRGLPDATYHETELRCDLGNGARIALYGADDPDSLRGLYLDGVVLDEYAQMRPRVWSEVIPSDPAAHTQSHGHWSN